MILDGFNNQPVDKIISVPGPQGPPGLSGITQNLRRPQRNTIAGIGDSMIGRDSLSPMPGGGAYQPFLSRNFFQQLPILTHQRIRYDAAMFAMPSSYVSDQQSLQLPNILAMNPLPGACIIAAGAAEMVDNASYNFATNQGLIKTMVAALLAVGVVPILWTVPPIKAAGFPISVATINTRLNQWNVWIRRYASINGFPLVDAHAALAQVDGTHIPGSSDDLLHPNGVGNRLIAQQALADGLANIFPPNSLVDTARTTDDLTNLFNNGTINLGLFTTSSSGIGTGLTAGGTATNSVVAPAPTDQMLGNWQQMTVSSGNNATLQGSITSGWSVGDTIAFSCRVQTQNMESTGSQFMVALRSSTPGGYTLSNGTVLTLLWSGIANWTATDIADGQLYIEYVIPAAATDLKFYSYIVSVPSGTATLRVGEVTIRNLTTGGFLV